MHINIERTVLSSLMDDHLSFESQQLNKQHINTIDVKDFKFSLHQLIFSSILKLESTNMPISIDLVHNMIGDKYHLELLDIMTANPAADISPYIKTIKEARYKQDILVELDKGRNGLDLNIRKIQNQINNLENLSSISQNRIIDENFINFFDKYNLNPKKVKDLKVEYLYKNMIVKNEVTMIAAKPSSGKSLTTIGFVNMALVNDDVDYVFYFDLDNSLTTLKERNIHELSTIWGKKLQYIHPSFVEKSMIWQMIKELQKRDLSSCLVVFDSAKNFMQNGDRDKNKDVSKVTEIFKRLRDKNATVIFLHHTNKPTHDLNDLVYAGSSAWEEDSSNAFILTQNEHKKTFIFSPFKKRVGVIEPIAFAYNKNHTLAKIDYFEASETQEIEEINDEIKAFIEEQNQKPNYSKIMLHLQKEGYSRNKVNLALQNGKNRYWKEQKLTQNNRSVYTLIAQAIDTTYEDISDNSLNKCDKSDKSYLRDSISIDNDEYKSDKSELNQETFVYQEEINNIKIEIPII